MQPHVVRIEETGPKTRNNPLPVPGEGLQTHVGARCFVKSERDGIVRFFLWRMRYNYQVGLNLHSRQN
jgi:hypothetical protein